MKSNELDTRFYYEPMLAGHPKPGSLPVNRFLGFEMQVPLWVSSMTGGTKEAHTINHNLARACGEFGFGMGLGSCRSLLQSDDNLADFAVKDLMPHQPLFANLGIAQVETLVLQKAYDQLYALVDKLNADGLILHINPMQEAMQPEGDAFHLPPIEVVEQVLENFDRPIIVKEVGQGMGRESLKRLLQLPLAAIDFAASGGTNFALLELLRGSQEKLETFRRWANIGHSAEDMVNISNQLLLEMGDEVKVKDVIISGGIKHFLDGYYLINKLQTNAIYGQASAFLKHARGPYEKLQTYVRSQIKGLELANAFLRIRS